MALIEHTLFGVRDRVADAVGRLKLFEPPEGYYLAFSGGKDSCVVKHLCQRAGVKFDAHYNLTTVDPPELVNFIRAHHSDVIWDRPKLSMWELIAKKVMPPTRLVRYCCEKLKEGGGLGRFVSTGVRAAESYKRSQRRMVEQCRKKGGRSYLHPILDWSDRDVWEYIRGNNLPYCCLYDQGFTRVGCVGCPMAGREGMLRAFARWPKYRENYIRAFGKMLEHRRDKDLLTKWTNAESVFDWWVNGSDKTPDAEPMMFE